MTRPAGRYDEQSAGHRVGTVAAATVVALLLLGGGYLLYARHNAGSLPSELRGYRLLSERSVLVTFSVQIGAGRRGQCKVRARGRTGEQVGAAIIDVGPSSRRTLTVSYPLVTSARASSGEVVGCRRS